MFCIKGYRLKQGKRESFSKATKAILLSLTLMHFPVLRSHLLLLLGTGKALPWQELSGTKWFIDLNVEAICKQLGEGEDPDWLMPSLWLAKYAFHL